MPENDQTPSIESAMIANATGPKKVQTEAGSVEQHSLAEQMAMDKYLASKRAAHQSGLGIRIQKLSPDGTI